MSLLGSKPHPNIMSSSTGKNVVDYFHASTIKYVAWCYGLRFLPSVIILSLANLLSIWDLKLTCGKAVRELVTSSSEEFQKILLHFVTIVALPHFAAKLAKILNTHLKNTNSIEITVPKYLNQINFTLMRQAWNTFGVKLKWQSELSELLKQSILTMLSIKLSVVWTKL